MALSLSCATPAKTCYSFPPATLASVKAYIIVLKDTVVTQDIETAERAIIKVGGTVEHRYTSALKGFSAWLSSRAYKTLLANPLVAYIEEDGQGNALMS
jgi:hypothetical protein